jgi:hypothetical protein
VKRLLVLPLLAACGHGVTLDVPTQTKLTALACDADRLCQADGNLSDDNFPLMPHHDAACVNLARTWLQASGAHCGAAK